jgi:predicted NAD-dependent protein-ADP-ribosyltransferase YbiA (DUF1768 family)
MTIKIKSNAYNAPYSYMSMMHEAPLRYNDFKYRNAMQLFMVMCIEKSHFIREQVKQDYIDNIKQLRTFDSIRLRWIGLFQQNEFDITMQKEVMAFCIQLKLTQYPEIQKKLALTGQQKISDQSIINGFWCDYDEGTPYKGQNQSGLLWMEAREEFLKKERYQLQYNANQVTLIFRESSEEITIDVNRFTVLPKNMKVDFNQRLTGSDGFASFFNKRVMANSELSIFSTQHNIILDNVVIGRFKATLERSLKDWVKKMNDPSNIMFDTANHRIILKLSSSIAIAVEHPEDIEIKMPVRKVFNEALFNKMNEVEAPTVNEYQNMMLSVMEETLDIFPVTQKIDAGISFSRNTFLLMNEQGLGIYHSTIKKTPIDKKDDASNPDNETNAKDEKEGAKKKVKSNLDKDGIKEFITQNGLEECQKLVNEGDFSNAIKSLNEIVKNWDDRVIALDANLLDSQIEILGVTKLKKMD